MNLRRLRAVARKEFIHIRRDPLSLGMAIVIPMLLLVLFGSALTLDVDNVPLTVWDQSRSAESRDLLSHFSGSRYFRISSFESGYAGIEREINHGRALAALIIPGDFATSHKRKPPPLQLILDGSDANTATIAAGYARAVAAGFGRPLAVTPPPASIDLRPRVWFNSDLESKNFIVPGLIAVIMMVIAALLTSLTFAREWELGTMEQLISTPVRGPELIFGKLIPYFAIGMLDVALAVLMSTVLFHVPLRGSLFLLFGMSTIFLAGVLSLGMLISIVTRNQLLASQLAIVVTFLPSYLLSGFMFALSNTPVPIQLVSHLVPARYFITIIRGVYLKGIGLHVLAREALLLLVFSVLVITAANAAFRRKVAE